MALLPFNNVLPKTNVLFAERYVYVALLPFTIAVAWLLRPRGAGGARLVPAALAAGILVALTAHRLPVWTDSVSLWDDAARKAPESALVQCQLAQAYESDARLGAAGDAVASNARAQASWRRPCGGS